MTKQFCRIFTVSDGGQVLYRLDLDGGTWFVIASMLMPGVMMEAKTEFETYDEGIEWINNREEHNAEDFFINVTNALMEKDAESPGFLQWYEIFADAMRNAYHYPDPLDMEEAKKAFDEERSPTEFAHTYYMDKMNA